MLAAFFLAKEARADDGYILVKEGTPMWVMVEPEGWVSATSRQGDKDAPPKGIKTWETVAEAVTFMRNWGGHPWYAVPGTWEILPVVPVMKEVFSHYSLANAQDDLHPPGGKR